VRDDAGGVTQAFLELAVQAVTRRRTLLWVDDTDFQKDTVGEAAEDARWLAVLTAASRSSGLAFDANLDAYDAIANRRQPPPLSKLLDYTTVIWSNRSGIGGSSALRISGRFFDPYPQRNWNSNNPYSILLSYLASGGKLWISGFRPARQLWPDERERGREADPVNVTNWDDPIQSHASIDSVGTGSVLYRMGVEMFDFGSSMEIRRLTRQHFCLGLRPDDLPGTPVLRVSAAWPQGGTDGRTNVEIYNMPGALATQAPPLVPPPWTGVVLYTYVSGLTADPERGFVYPATADGQPAFILAKASPSDPHFARAFCGFEVYLREHESHLRLVEFVLAQFGQAPPIQAGPGRSGL
jgi:hypothetical protein